MPTTPAAQPNPPDAMTIDAYIAAAPEEVRSRLEEVRAAIRAEAPDAVEAIKYRLPTFVLRGKNLVHFGAFKEHIGFYPTPSGMTAFAPELARYAGAKGSVRFPLSEPLPLDLIRRITAARVAEVSRK